MRQFLPRALGLLTIAALFAPPAAAGEPKPSPEARVHFKAGVEALKRRRWEEAYREFKDAYAITPRWTVLGNLAIAAQHLERDGEAMDAMEQYLERGKKEISPAEEAEVGESLEKLRARTAEVTIKVPGSFSIVDTRVGESEVVNEYGPFEERTTLFVRAGQHTFKVENARAEIPAWRVTLLAGDATTHTFAVEPEPQPAVEEESQVASAAEQSGKPRYADKEAVAPSHTASYILWAVGGVGAGAAAFIGLRAQALQREADRKYAEQCPSGATGTNGCVNITDDSERVAGWRTVGLVTGLGALGVLVTGTVLYFFPGDSTTARTDASAASLQPWASTSAVGVAGTF
jgi:hypothetical protein